MDEDTANVSETDFQELEPYELGKGLAKKFIEFAEDQVTALNLNDLDQVSFWGGFHVGINAVE